MQGFHETLTSAGEDGAALSNTTAPTSIIPASRKIVLPAGWFNALGRSLRIRAGGRISTAGASPGTLTFDVRFGSTVVFNGGASGTLATSAANLTWWLEIILALRSISGGASPTAALLGIGRLYSAALSAATPLMLLPASAPAAGNTFDPSAAQAVDLFAAWSVANASNSLTCHLFSVDSLNSM